MKQYLPSKTFFIGILGFVLGVAVIVALVYVLRRVNTPKPTQELSPQQRLIVGEQILEDIQMIEKQDTDGDGLYDWEEALWGTDPNEPDSDNDGIDDKSQIESIKKENNIVSSQAGDQSSQNENLTDLDLISRDLYSTIAYLQQQGKLDEAGGQVEALFQEAVLQSSLYDPITISDVSLLSTSPDTVRVYFAQIESLLVRYPLEQEDFVFVIQNSQRELKQEEALDAVEQYREYFTEAQALEVPIDFQIQHLAYVNSVGRLFTSLEQILYADAEPLAGLSSTIQLNDILADYTQAISDLYAPIINSSNI